MLAAVTALAALASTDYPGTVHVDGFNLPAAVTVSQSGDNYTVTFGNFSQLGTVEITAPGTTTDGVTTIVTSQQIDGGLASAVIAFNQYALGANIDILTPEGITKTVTFTQDGEATGYQIKNSGFENFKSDGEPFAWHGFQTATGSWAGAAQGQLGSSDEVREGATGNCAVITAGSVMGFVNNGTMTTGRLNAGSMFPTNTANCSKMDFSVTDTDANGDHYYTIMHGRPDAITVWMKFSQGTANSNYPYASFSAIITDGTYYQDPENTNYTNKLATAKNVTITTGDWRKVTIPFSYIDENVDGKGLLVTISTNATPGQGSSGDKVWVDDIAMVYNAAITGITVKGNALEGFSQDVYEYNIPLAVGETVSESDIAATLVSEHSYLVKKVVETDDAFKVLVAVVSNDINTVKVYTINYLKPVVLEGVKFINGRHWATWFGNQNLELPKNVNVTANVVTAINDNNVTINPVNYIPAGVGVLLYSDRQDIESVSAAITEAKDPAPTSLLLGATKEASVTNAYVLYNNQFILAQDGTTVAAHRCYLPVEGDVMNAPRMLMIGDDQGTVTAIDDLTTSGRRIEAVYNAQGQRVNENATGILIIRYSDGTTTKVIR